MSDNTQPLSDASEGKIIDKSECKKLLDNKSRILAVIGFLAFFILLIVYLTKHSAQKTASHVYNKTYPFTKPVRTGSSLTFRIGVMTDLDKSAIDADKKHNWKAYMKRGYLSYNPTNQDVQIQWDTETDQEPQQLNNGYSYKGRGMELSELIVFDGKLLTLGDKTGLVFEVVRQSDLVPWLILADADGTSTKGFKSEWATVKDEKLYVGSHGRLTNTSNGSVSDDMTYVKIITPTGEVSHIPWLSEYQRLGRALNITFPGYVVHESAEWSDEHKKWYFLPRKCSQEAFDAETSDKLGCNYLLSADDGCVNIKVIQLETDTTRGYSSFKFIPASQDTAIVALRTEEIGDYTATYVSAFTVTGRILVNDTKISDLKYEGIEFL